MSVKPDQARESQASAERIRVVVLEPNPFYRRGLVSTIESHGELEVVAEAADRQEAIPLVRDLDPDVLVLDEQAGVAVLETLGDGPRSVVLSGSSSMEWAYRALAAGAGAYLSKDEADMRGLCEAILAVTRGQMVISSSVQTGIAHDIRRQRSSPTPRLTDREREVLTLTAQGLTAAASAQRLGLSTATVKTHLHHVYKKLGVSGRAAAVAEAMRSGLVD